MSRMRKTKFNHHAQPIETNVKTSIEAGFIEFFIGLICAAFAYFTYDVAIVLFVTHQDVTTELNF